MEIYLTNIFGYTYGSKNKESAKNSAYFKKQLYIIDKLLISNLR